MNSHYATASSILEAAADVGMAFGASELAPRVRRTPRQIELELTRLASYGLVSKVEDRWTLSEPGAALAEMLNTAFVSARARAEENFSSFTTYVPKYWWPDGLGRHAS